MAASNSTLTSLWEDIDLGTGSPSKLGQHGGEIKEETLQYYKDTGLDSVAREAGIIDANGELYSTQAMPVQQRPTLNQIQMIAVPVGSPMNLKNQVQLVNVGQPQVLQPQVIQTTPKGAQMDNVLGTPVQYEQIHNWSGSSQKRRSDLFDLGYPDGKRKKQEKGGKGLRHFSMKVCEKVQKKGVTSYNEVADELVTEFSDPRNMTPSDQVAQYDQKNIRRRVYDALNVLMAMNIISKEKKEIRWIGLPTNSIQECQNLEMDKRRRIERIKHKTQQLQELILQQIAFKNLVERNRSLESAQGPPASNSAIQLPFIIVNTSKKTVIDCSISNDKYEYLFNFDNTFEIHDDIEVLKRMGLAFGLEKNKCANVDLQKAVKMIPKSLEPYVYELANTTAPRDAGPSGLSSIAASSSSLSPLATPLGSGIEDAEVAMATQGLSRQSSLTSFSIRDSPEDNYSDDSDSDRSSPVLDV